MRAETALGLALLVVLAAASPVAAVAVQGERAPAGIDHAEASTAAQATTPSADERTVHLEVQLRESGDADWTVSTYVPLDGPNETAAFEEMGRRYVDGSAGAGPDVEQFRRFVAAAEASSARAMSIPRASVERSWTVENGTGVLRLRFTWRNFAREGTDELVVDDVFETQSGGLDRLEAGQVLVIYPPEGQGFVDTPRGKGLTDGALRWEGPRTFGPDYFQIAYRSSPDDTPTRSLTPTPTTPTTAPPTDTPTPPDRSLLYLLLVLVGGAGGVAYFLVRRDAGGTTDPGPAGSKPDGGPSGTAVTDGNDVAAGDPAAQRDATPDGPPEPTPEDPFAGVDVEMLSDEERVLRLLDANGGRMKQARIVKETDWSNAKVSQLLSGMDDDGEIDKLRIGRENLISLPDVDVDSFEE